MDITVKYRAGIWILLIMLCLSVTPAFCQTDPSGSQLNERLLEEQLNNSEIKNIQNAIDKALNTSGLPDDYRFSAEEMMTNALKGKPMDNLRGFPKMLFALLGKEIKANLVLILEMYCVMLLGTVIRALSPMDSGIPGQVASLSVNGVLIIIAAVSFGSVTQVVLSTIDSMQNIAAFVMPALFALMAASGRIVSVSAMQPIMLLGVNTACHVFKTILLPLTIMAGILFLVDSVSERFKLKTLAKLLKSCSVWVTGAITLAFSIAVSIQKLASGTVDQVALKTTKFAIGTFIPVAGKYMSDAADTILLYTSAARNAAGVLTIIGLGLISVTPFIKVFIVMLALRITAAFGAPLCDECISDALEDAAGCLSVILGIMGASLFVLVLLTGTFMSSSGLMT